MKIAYISTYLPQQCGIATYTDYLIKGIREVAPLLEIKVVAEKGALPINEEKFEVIPCWDRNENYTESIITHTNADIVHIQHEYSIYKFDDRLPMVLKRLNSATKKIITIHCVRPGEFCERGTVDENFAKRIAELSDEVIVHLEPQKSILTRLGISSEKIHIIPHGSELSNEEKKNSRKKLGLPEDGKILLMFGFVRPHKCVHTVIEALVQILKEVKNVYIFIAGGLGTTAIQRDKEYVKFIKNKIKELNLDKSIIFPNRFFPNDDVPYLFGASDIVLFPYYEEDRSASGAFHLAIGAKKPIIASRVPKFEGLKNICDELLVLPYNSSGIAKLVIRLFKDSEFKQFILDRTEDYRKETSWKSVAKKHLEVYNK